MASRPVYLVLDRNRARDRAHFFLFVPNAAFASATPIAERCVGTAIHVTGLPMSGFLHEFKRNFDTASTPTLRKAVRLGSVTADQLPEPETADFVRNDTALGTMDRLALQVPPPRKSENFLAPVNDVTNRRCQEWTMDYVRLLVEYGLLGDEAIELVQAERDPPEHGIGLQKSGQLASLP